MMRPSTSPSLTTVNPHPYQLTIFDALRVDRRALSQQQLHHLRVAAFARQHQLAHQHQAFVDALNVDRRALKAYRTVSINALFLS